MTNYNVRLDEILCDTLNGEGVYREYSGKVKAAGQVEAKQAITSLTKELVAEAKPEVKAHPLGPVTLATCQRGLDHYEANLLKALEEV